MTDRQLWYRQVYLKSDHWKEFRLSILNSCSHSCLGCYSKSKLQIHHLTYARLWKERQGDVMVLCESCHIKTHLLWKTPPKEFTPDQLRICLKHFLYYSSQRIKESAAIRGKKNKPYNRLPMKLRILLKEAKEKLKSL